MHAHAQRAIVDKSTEVALHVLACMPLQQHSLAVCHLPGVALQTPACLQAALDSITDSRLFALSARHVTVSTVGVTDKIRALASDAPNARLALSLHAPTQALRERIVPSAKAYKLPALLGAVRDYVEATGNRVFVEYVMLRGVNDEPQHAQQLAEVLADLPVTVNLIPWNPVLSPDISFEAPGLERVRPLCVDVHAPVDMPVRPYRHASFRDVATRLMPVACRFRYHARPACRCVPSCIVNVVLVHGVEATGCEWCCGVGAGSGVSGCTA